MRLLFSLIALTFISCNHYEQDLLISKEPIKELQIKDYRLNYTSRYRILETKTSNKWKRDLVLYLNKKESKRVPILYKEKKALSVDWYHQQKELSYELLNDSTIKITEFIYHRENQLIKDIDTLIKTIQIYEDSERFI